MNALRPRHLLACALLLLPLAAGAGTPTTFAVSAGSFSAWTIDGQANPPLTLERGRTYVFDLTGVSAVHPFNINTSNTTGNGARYNSGVTNNGATGNTDITFVVPLDAPASLHYNCGNHAAMNGAITVVDPVVDPVFANGFELGAGRPGKSSR
ncbi:hypothetical protein [Tahibacter harae]|uniref:Blue (type 1) copper domain-containing protein n=1 Tax=Tahibacter harae TaxID=2963937 RepID=A0ABT1QMT1_9GAMM|nr:hypothetical protein [Tahibacter harae]MCQ4163732.1 hypothetical protein [Tahibacter harae]